MVPCLLAIADLEGVKKVSGGGTGCSQEHDDLSIVRKEHY